MLSIPGRISRLCDGSLTRREWLQIGGCGLLGLSLPSFLERKAAADAVESERRPQTPHQESEHTQQTPAVDACSQRDPQ